MQRPEDQLLASRPGPSTRLGIAIGLVIASLVAFAGGLGVAYRFALEGPQPENRCHMTDPQEFDACVARESKKSGYDAARGWWVFAFVSCVVAAVLAVPELIMRTSPRPATPHPTTPARTSTSSTSSSPNKRDS